MKTNNNHDEDAEYEYFDSAMKTVVIVFISILIGATTMLYVLTQLAKI